MERKADLELRRSVGLPDPSSRSSLILLPFPPDPAENSKGIREEKEEEEGGEEVDLTDWLIYGRRRSLGVGDSEGTKGCWVHKLYKRTLYKRWLTKQIDLDKGHVLF